MRYEPGGVRGSGSAEFSGGVGLRMHPGKQCLGGVSGTGSFHGFISHELFHGSGLGVEVGGVGSGTLL